MKGRRKWLSRNGKRGVGKGRGGKGRGGKGSGLWKIGWGGWKGMGRGRVEREVSFGGKK